MTFILGSLHAYPVIGCLLLSSVAGSFGIWAFFRIVERLRDKTRQTGAGAWLPFVLGVIERTLYFGAAALSTYEIVAGWLALKAVAKFAETSSASARARRKEEAETVTVYYLYICGNGLSLIIGLGCGLLARHLQGLDLIVRG